MSAEHGEKKSKDQRGKGTGCIYKPKDSDGVPAKYWYIAYMSGGKRRYESSRSVLWKDAQKLLSQRLGDTAKGIVVTPQVGKTTLWNGLKAVIDFQKQNGRKSIAHTERRIELHILKFFYSAQPMASISTTDIERYVAHRLEQKAKPASVNRELAILRQAFLKEVKAGRLLARPDIRLLRENNVREVYWEPAEFQLLVDELAKTYPEYIPPLRFAYTMGWRLRSEILPMQASQVDLNVGVVRLLIGTTKSGKGRTVYLTPELHKLFSKQLQSIETLKKRGKICPYVFHRANGQRILNFNTAFKRACTAVGLPDKHFHDLRRTAVRNLVRSGVPERVAMSITGHKTAAVFARYDIVAPTDLQEAAVKISAWGAVGDAPKARVVKFSRRAGAGRGR